MSFSVSWIKVLGVIAILLSTMGCTITQTVNKPSFDVASTPELCVIDNPAVYSPFLAFYTAALTKKGFVVKMQPQGAALDSCVAVSTYTALRSWDMVVYLAYTELTFYKQGNVSGNAVYDARQGSGNIGQKFIDAEQKVYELVELALAQPPLIWQ